jgi:hypothetical protein
MGGVCVGKNFPADFVDIGRDVVLTDTILICGADTGVDKKTTIGAVLQKVIINFNSATPSIANYQATYAAIYGQYPNARLIWIDPAGDWNEWMQSPKFNIVGGVVDSISWDLGEILAGFIILT